MRLLLPILLALPAALAVRVMPLGDSITGSPGCWRALLYNNLVSAGAQNLDMVGTLPAQGCGVSYDGDNEGHGGYLATNIASQNLLPGWLSSTNPDVVIMHLGTNDVWSSISPSNLLAAFTKLVGQMRANNPNVKVLVGS
jgi:lysophospholipase L1-like esterase